MGQVQYLRWYWKANADEFCHLPPWKRTWQWKITIFHHRYIFKWLVFHLHVSGYSIRWGLDFLHSPILFLAKIPNNHLGCKNRWTYGDKLPTWTGWPDFLKHEAYWICCMELKKHVLHCPFGITFIFPLFQVFHPYHLFIPSWELINISSTVWHFLIRWSLWLSHLGWDSRSPKNVMWSWWWQARILGGV